MKNSLLQFKILFIAFFALIIVYSALIASTNNPEMGRMGSSQVAQAGATATITLSPSGKTTAVGGTFNVDLVLTTGGQAVYGVDINKLNFNPSYLQIVQITPGTILPFVATKTIDNVQGSAKLSVVANPGTTYSNATGVIATVTFKQYSAGTSNVTMDFTLGRGNDSNVAGASGDILGSVGSGLYTGDPTILPDLPPTPTQSPSPSGSPSGSPSPSPSVSPSISPTPSPTVIPFTITNIRAEVSSNNSVTISFDTSKPALDSIDLGTSENYSQLLTYSDSYATHHSRVISGLLSATTYHYLVRVRDTDGSIVETSDGTFTLNSSQAPTPTYTPPMYLDVTPTPTPDMQASEPPPVLIQSKTPSSQRQVYTSYGSGSGNSIETLASEGDDQPLIPYERKPVWWYLFHLILDAVDRVWDLIVGIFRIMVIGSFLNDKIRP